MFNRFLQKLILVGEKGLEILFKPAETPRVKWMETILLGALFIVGLLHWGYFLNWFNNRFDIGDWHQYVAPYLIFLSKAFQSGQLPFQGAGPLLIPGQYLARPNRPFSPQILLLFFLDPAKFVLLNVWLMYAVGFAGLLVIKKRYALSLSSFILFFLLFNFNGHITDQYIVGHIEWVGYFLLPFFVLLVLHMLEGGKTGWGWTACMAVTILVINLQGAFHFFLWSMAFMLILAVFQPRFWGPVIKAIIASGLLSMIRILQAVVEYYKGSSITFMTGFTSITQLLDSFVVLHPPYLLDIQTVQIGGWEFDFYLGLVGFAFMVYFGVIKSWVNQKKYRSLYLPMLVMLFFSLGDMYRPLFYSPIPFMDSQRAPTRFIIVPVIFLITLASIQFESSIKHWDLEKWKEEVIVLAGIAFIGFDLFQHSSYWRLSNLTTKVLEKFTSVVQVTVVNRPELPYLLSIIVGLGLTVIALIILAIFALREWKLSRPKLLQSAP